MKPQAHISLSVMLQVNSSSYLLNNKVVLSVRVWSLLYRQDRRYVAALQIVLISKLFIGESPPCVLTRHQDPPTEAERRRVITTSYVAQTHFLDPLSPLLDGNINITSYISFLNTFGSVFTSYNAEWTRKLAPEQRN